MRAVKLLKILVKHGCIRLRRRGSHVRIRCDKCFTTVPVHFGEELGIGLMKAIVRDLEPCLGKGWLQQ